MTRTNLVLGSLCMLLLGALLGANFIAPAQAGVRGSWTCYRVNEFPDVKNASEWKAAERVSSGLSQTAPHAPSGTVVATKWDDGNADILCVKE